MRGILVLATALALPATAGAATVTVNCNRGESINQALGRLDPKVPNTVRVRGTCAEYVVIRGFDGLTLRAVPAGGALVQPATPPDPLVATLVFVDASRSVTIEGLSITAPPTLGTAVAIGRGSTDVRLRSLTVTGGGIGIVAFESSQISLAGITARDHGYGSVGAYDGSDVHIEDSLFENTTGALWHAGIDVGASHVTIHAITIRNMQAGIHVNFKGSVDLADFGAYFPSDGHPDVVIENTVGTSFYGVLLEAGSSLNANSNVPLHITGAGQTWGYSSAGVSLSDGSVFNAGPNLDIAGSLGQGVFVANGSTASLSGPHINGGMHGGVVAVNHSTIALLSNATPATIGGNATDLYCDSTSLITGTANVAGTPVTQCAHVLAGDYEPLP
jgi:Right handed beta helix region